MGILDHLTRFLRNLYAGQEATVKTRHGKMDWFKLSKEYIKAVYCHPVINLYVLLCIGEGNGNPLQCSCLESPRAWWAAVYGVAQSRTRLKRLSSSSRFVIAFLPRSKRLSTPRLQSLSAVIFEPKKIKFLTVYPSIWHEVMRPDAMILVFCMLSFKPTFSVSSFPFIKWLFSFSSLSAIRVVSSVYLRLLIFLPAIFLFCF